MSHLFTVWAPRADRVALVLAESGEATRRVDMTPGAPRSGWWAASVDSAGPGTDYGFSLDGGPVRPDPRSPWQPAGPEGPSRVVDHGAFAWTDAEWRGFHLPTGLVYELHVGTFSADGTFEGVIPYLDHLVTLGVTAIELMPVAEFPGRWGWGYDGVNLYAPHHGYGGPMGLKRLVDACHARGLGVMLDVVYNHLGPAGNHLDEFGPYFTDRYRTPWGQAVNYDGPDSDDVRRFFADNALMWHSDFHVDGLRLDAVHAIFDSSAVHILEQLASEVSELSETSGLQRWLVAESDLNDPRIVRPAAAGGYGVDAQWSDDFHHSVHAALTGEDGGYYADFSTSDLRDVGAALRGGFVYDGRYSPHRRRTHGRPTTGLSGWSLLGYSQTHDQVGNRAAGERSAALLSPGRLRVAAALVLTSPFVPLLFQGEEWAASTPFQYFTDHPDPELGRAVSEGRRREFEAFGWDPPDVPDPQDHKTFLRSQLDWAELADPGHAAVLAWYRGLIQLRRAEPDLTDGRLDRVSVTHPGPGLMTVGRGRILLATNISPAPVVMAVPGGAALVLASDGRCALDGRDLSLPPDSAAVVRVPHRGH